MTRAEFTPGVLRCLSYTDRRVDAALPPPPAPVRVAAFSSGDRVIAPPTAGAPDPVYRAGGHGEVIEVREWSGSVSMAYVQLDDSTDIAQPYRFAELRREPTI